MAVGGEIPAALSLATGTVAFASADAGSTIGVAACQKKAAAERPVCSTEVRRETAGATRAPAASSTRASLHLTSLPLFASTSADETSATRRSGPPYAARSDKAAEGSSEAESSNPMSALSARRVAVPGAYVESETHRRGKAR
eukprot:scaffold170325_cov27-Tisochrysis_lutea.AAC.4